MAKIKSYTDISQSKKLAEILPPESADMCYLKREINSTFIETSIIKPIGGVEKSLCCWSLTALLSVLPDYSLQTNTDGSVFVICESSQSMISGACHNPVDACVEMIECLHELNLL